MANLTKSYETVFVLSNKLTEDATAELVKKFTDLIAANGTIDSIDEWGSADWPTRSTTSRKATMFSSISLLPTSSLPSWIVSTRSLKA